MRMLQHKKNSCAQLQKNLLTCSGERSPSFSSFTSSFLVMNPMNKLESVKRKTTCSTVYAFNSFRERKFVKGVRGANVGERMLTRNVGKGTLAREYLQRATFRTFVRLRGTTLRATVLSAPLYYQSLLRE